MIGRTTVQTTIVGEHAVVVVEGEVDLSSSPAFRESVIAAIETGGPELIVDLSGVTFMDSSGLNVLAGAVKRIGPTALKVVGSQPVILRLFTLSGLDKVFSLYETMEAALDATG